MTADTRREQVISGLNSRIKWCLAHNRPRAEIAKVVEHQLDAAATFVREDSARDFYQVLATRGDGQE